MTKYSLRWATLTLLTLCSLFGLMNGDFGLISVPVGIGAATLGGSAIYYGVKCRFGECCGEKRWFPRNVTGMRSTFQRILYGQHLVSKSVYDALRSHLSKTDLSPPTHPLVLSFHGWTGCGKNYVAKIIAEHLYKEGLKSKYVKHFIATLHFTGCLVDHCPDEKKQTAYREFIQKEISSRVASCRHSLFIFDEMDKMPLGLIDAISAFLDHRDSIDGLDFRFAVFIFLSNAGGNAIAKKSFEFYQNGRPRDELTIRDLEGTIGLSVFNSDEGGLKRSSIVAHNLIDHFIPFLPLERQHVKKCVEDYLKDKRIVFGERDAAGVVKRFKKKEVTFVENVLDELEFDSYNLYSVSGCKRISAKVELLLPDVEEELVDSPWRL